MNVRHFHWSAAPVGVNRVQKANFINVQLDAIGIGLANAAIPFLPVFLTKLGGSNFQIGLLTAMPAVTGLFLSIAVGGYLQNHRNLISWYSWSRLLSISGYTLTGLAAFFVPKEYLVSVVLLIWGLVTLPQTVVSVSFSVVMNAVAGPANRYELMSRRWSILGLVTAVIVMLVGQVLDQIGFPLNYQFVFIALSVGGLISYYFSIRIKLPETELEEDHTGTTLSQRYAHYKDLLLGHADFLRFTAKQFVFLSGTMLSVPLFPLYFVRVVNASNAWIGIINTAQTAVLLIGYFLWTRGSKLRGSRFVLLWTTLGLAFYPALVAATQQVFLIAILAGIAGIFQAGVNLVFFDELMKTVPPKQSATFVSIAQSLQYLPAIVAPLFGSLLANWIGIGGALLVSAGLRLLGFILFASGKPETAPSRELSPSS
jgi:hypothetical protein